METVLNAFNETLSLENLRKLYLPDVDYCYVPITELHLDPPYQRPRSKAFIKMVVDNYNPNQLRPAKVSKRDDGSYYVWDGQHTVEIIRLYCERKGIPNPEVPSMIYNNLSYADEATLFANQSEFVRKMQKVDIFKALLEAEDEGAISLERIVQSFGFQISAKKMDGCLYCITTLENIRNRENGEELLCRVLDLLHETWDGKKEYLKAQFIAALADIIEFSGNKFSEDIFFKQFRVISYDEIVLESKQYGRDKMLSAILYFYNKGISSNKKIRFAK